MVDEMGARCCSIMMSQPKSSEMDKMLRHQWALPHYWWPKSSSPHQKKKFIVSLWLSGVRYTRLCRVYYSCLQIYDTPTDFLADKDFTEFPDFRYKLGLSFPHSLPIDRSICMYLKTVFTFEMCELSSWHDQNLIIVTAITCSWYHLLNCRSSEGIKQAYKSSMKMACYLLPLY